MVDGPSRNFGTSTPRLVPSSSSVPNPLEPANAFMRKEDTCKVPKFLAVAHDHRSDGTGPLIFL
jgi:hypothetical protein